MMMKLSLRKRLTVLSCSIIVPLCILVLSLIFMLISYGYKYDDVVNNISVINRYNTTFKECIDYTSYRMVIGGKTADELVAAKDPDDMYEGQKIQEPHELIGSAEKDFKYLLTVTKDKKNASRIRWILKCLETLDESTEKIGKQVKKSGYYADNMNLLINGIYIITEDVQKNIQEYVYYETLSFEEIRHDLTNSIFHSVQISIAALIGILGISIMISRKIANSVSNPIQELCAATELVAHGDFTSPTEIDSGNELQVLTNSFNHMKSAIAILVEDVKKEQKKLRVTELRLLQAQINPHFLYNTLDTIMWLAEGGDTKQVVLMVSALSDFFRTVLSEGKEMISIQEEEAHIRSYLVIQQFRYQDIMEYEIDIDPSIYNNLILKLTLQPLVENALYHGIKNKRGGGKIWVKGYQVEKIIILKVTDNGIGMDEEELRTLEMHVKEKKGRKSGSFGLRNVNERIQITYGEEYGLSFESTKGKGTTVTVTLPALN